MSINPEEFYHQQKKVQQDHDRASAKGEKHGTMETWQIEQEEADRGVFVPDPMDKTAPSQKKSGFFARIMRAITGKS